MSNVEPIRIATRGQNGNGVPNAWRNETPFTTSGALSGKFYRVGNGLGRLPDEFRPIFAEWVKRYGIRLYVVYSYGTPIAWRCGNETCKPQTKYSLTTSRHQGMLY